MRLTQRVSINLEAPNARRLLPLSRDKQFEDNLERMKWIHQLQQPSGRGRPPSQITQFVVGAAGESDREILETAGRLYRTLNLSRAYYSAFHPIPDTPLSRTPSASLLREHRLYQADWLLRFYGFGVEEIPFDEEGRLPLAADPKTAWAIRHPELFPIEIQRADYPTLLRIPGVGPTSAGRILEIRSQTPIRDPAVLRRCGVAIKRAAPFILLNGKGMRLNSLPPDPVQTDEQMALF
jgi:predicted DNA-binding helix-hairpin-helix protein